MSLHAKAAVTGIGETRYSLRSEQSSAEMQFEASLRAIADAGLRPRDIDGIIPLGITALPAEDYITNFGIADLRLSATTPLGGASPASAIQCAAMAIAAGVCRHVLIPFGRNVSSGMRAGVRIHTMPQFHLVTEFEYPMGAIAPAQLYAPMARRHMELYGTTIEHFAEVAIACREHAMLNDNAIMRKPITVADHHASRMISDPFRLLDCSLEGDGGTAIVVSSADYARDAPQPSVLVLGVAEGHPDQPGSITQRADMTEVGLAKAAPRAFAMAGVTHDDIDLVQIYDCFTWVVLCELEDMGFCPKGEGGRFVEDGKLRRGGALPLNTHGGLLSQCHQWGLNHVTELVRQLRGQAGRAQVDGAAIGLATGYGDLGDGSLVIMGRG